MERVVLKRKSRVTEGHPWVFAGEVEAIPSGADGKIVEVYDARKRWIGYGYCNSKSNILVRILSRRQSDKITPDFYRDRLRECLELRQRFVKDTNAYRLVHSEADGLPGLVVDRYGDYLSMQILALGIEVQRDLLVEALAEMTGVKGIYERSDVFVRGLEGLQERKGVAWGEAPPKELLIQEGDAKFIVDLYEGQKTGFFLDQRLNRQQLGKLTQGKSVLNCFSYSGGFSIAAGLGGASSVLSIDISEGAVALGEANARLNGLDLEWRAANAFDCLREFDRDGKKFDVVILDPPAFTKTKDSIPGAERGYKEINLRGMHILNSGGLLVTSSCSHHIAHDHFLQIVQQAANDAGKRMKCVAYNGPGPDHPFLVSAPETRYLKCLFAEIY